MGRNSGGVTSSDKSGVLAPLEGATEKGYTAKMVKNIVGMEQKYRRNKDETLHVFNSKGDIVSSIGGKGAQVVFDPKKIPANSILTQNHPRSLGTNGIRRIGNSFSSDDIRSASRNPDIHVFCEKTKGRLGCISRCCVKGFCGCEQNGI